MEVTPYIPSDRFNNVQGLLSSHFRFSIEALPDFTFFVQSVSVPGVSGAAVERPNPLVKIKEAGDYLRYNQLRMSFMVDAQLKAYSSLFWWMKGYGFPHSSAEVADFRARRAQRITSIARPIVRDLEKTNATLYALQPDTENVLAEFRFTDVFPVALSDLSFTSTASSPEPIVCTAEFEFTEFDLYTP